MCASREDPLDRRVRAHQLSRTHEAVLSKDASFEEVPSEEVASEQRPRPMVYDSWRRSLAASVDPDSEEPPVTMSSDQLADVRAAHPLARCVPTFRRNLLGSLGEMPNIMIVTDEYGNILWREGNSEVCHSADRVRLAEGTRWAESAIGTNAMGTALATGQPVQIHSAEHLVRMYHSWTCAASPVHDPETGRMIGVLDISGPLHTVHPALRALVTATAQLAEGELEQWVRQRDERIRERHPNILRMLGGAPAALLSPSGRVIATEPGDLHLPSRVCPERADESGELGGGFVLEPLDEGYLLRMPHTAGRRTAGRSRLRLRFLGNGRPIAELDGQEHPVSLRHAELLTMLALRPEGVSAEQLALQVHGESGNPVTVRAEIHRLRRQLGGDVVRTKPYRLDARVTTDFHELRHALRKGDVRTAFEQHGPGLLPASEAPGIEQERAELAAGIRTALVHSMQPELLWDYSVTELGRDDIEVLERLNEVLPERDWRRGCVRERLHRIESSDE